jgi:hypothetical protein
MPTCADERPSNRDESVLLAWVPMGMGLVRSAAVIGIAKVIYDQARKPENQARIKSVIAQARSNRTRNSGGARQRHS